MKFRVLASEHTDENGKVFKAGEVLFSERPLDTIFRNKFQRINDSKPLSEPTLEILTEGIQSLDIGGSNPIPEQETAEEVKTIVPEGDLVDGLFDFDPEETGLHVYLREKRYFVYDEFDMSTPLNDKPLTKNKVLLFINSQQEK